MSGKLCHPVVLNLVVLRCTDLEKSLYFYQAIGCQFTEEKHGQGPKHYATRIGDVVVELYPVSKDTLLPSSVRLGFQVPSLSDAMTWFRRLGAEVVSEAASSPWGLRAV